MAEPIIDPQHEPDRSSEELPSGEQQVRIYCKHLMRMYAADQGLDTDQLREVTKQQFVNWCNLGSRMPQLDKQVQELADGLQITAFTIESVRYMLSDPFRACELLFPLWYDLTLMGLKPIKAPIDFFYINLCAGFRDNKIIQFRCPTKWNPDKPLTNGFACCLLQDQFRTIVHQIAMHGLDALYDQYAEPYNPEAMAGKITPPAIQGGDSHGPNEPNRAGDGFGF